MKETTVFLSDEEAIAARPRNITIRAMRGCAIVWFMPPRREGMIEIPERHRDQSVEALVIDDNTGHDLPPGTKVIVSRLKGDGEYFTPPGTDKKLCRVKRAGLYLIDESKAA